MSNIASRRTAGCTGLAAGATAAGSFCIGSSRFSLHTDAPRTFAAAQLSCLAQKGKLAYWKSEEERKV
jgi:hypothetical protein